MEITKLETFRPVNQHRHFEEKNAVIISRNPMDRIQTVFGDNIVNNVRL
jgi:hypothetical protein